MRRKFSVVFLCVLMGLSAPVFAQGTGKTNNHAAANSVGSLEINEAQDGTYIRVHGTSDPTFSVFKLTNPLRLFVDISGSQLDGDAITKRVGNGVISKVALIDFDENSQSVARLIIGFDTAAHYDVKADGNDVIVFVDGDKRRKSPKNVAKLQDKLDQVESKYRAKLASSEDRYNQAMSKLGNTRSELEATEQKLEQLRAEMTKASGEQRDRLASKIARQSDLLKETKAEITRREKKVAQLKGDLGQLRTERDKALQKVRKLERERQAALAQAEKAQQESTQARKRAQKLASELDTTRRALDSVASEKDQLKNRLDTMAQQAKQSSQKVDAQLAKLDAAKERQQQLEEQLASLRNSLSKGNESVRGELEKIEKEKVRLSKRLEGQLASLEKARKEAKSANERVASLQQLVDAREAEVAQLRRELEQARTQRSNDEAAQNTAELARLKQLRAKLEAEQKRVASLEQKRVAEQERLSELAQRRERAQQELSETEGQIEARRKELEGIRTREDLPAAKAVAINPNEANHVRDIRLETAQGRSRIVVELDRPSNFETLPWKDSRAVMILNGVELPEKLQRTLAPDAQGGAVRFVSSYTDESGKVRMEAELGEDASEVIRQEGNKVVWEFAPRMAANAPTQNSQMAANGQPRRTDDGQSFTSAPPNYPRTVADPTKVNTVPGMKRKRLTIDLRQADIQNVLRLLAKEGGVNIITGDGVDGSVTMRLRSVPLDQVFLTILQSQGLGFEVRGNVIRVAPQSVLIEEEKKRAEARARAEKLQPLEVFLLPVNYAEAGQMQAQVQGLLSPRGSVTVDERTNTLIIKDLPDNLASIRALVESLDSQVPQVLIEARIVETNDTFDRQLGIQWGGDFTFSQGNGNPTGLVFPSVLGVAGGATDGQTPTAGTASNPNFAVNLPAPAGTGAGGAIGLTMGSVGGSVNLNLRLSALESQGHAKLVSSPRILTLDNTEATISQGTSIPISVVSAAGVQTVFVDATLELTVRPHVTPDGNIQLQISASKNEPDFQNTGASGDPTIIRKQAETELLIKDGDTTVIGGIYTRNSGSSLSAVPFFHKIPILGNLFKTTSTSERRTELLIFITPRIVNRAQSLGTQSGAGAVTTE
ncbi:type IV pilus secretin PilQ [Persicimonas caeni]|nr:type IV pilus secretin PilQ [Persicimonas caeni]